MNKSFMRITIEYYDGDLIVEEKFYRLGDDIISNKKSKNKGRFVNLDGTMYHKKKDEPFFRRECIEPDEFFNEIFKGCESGLRKLNPNSTLGEYSRYYDVLRMAMNKAQEADEFLGADIDVPEIVTEYLNHLSFLGGVR